MSEVLLYRTLRGGGARQTQGPLMYRGTSFIRNRTHLGPYSRPMPMVLGRS